jgi:diguanylate cyclase (GGDEF)-like protein
MFARFHGRCRERLHSEAALLQAVVAVTEASRDCSQSVLRALSAALAALDPAIDAVLAFRQDADELACTFTCGERAEHFAGLRLRAGGTSLPAIAAVRGHHVALERGRKPVIPTDRDAIAVPMRAGQTFCAIVYASASRGSRIERDITVRAVAHAAVPYALAREREADRASATYDGLTGLYTPRAFRSILQGDLRAAELGRTTTLSLWFVDTDGFKLVNDAFGHAAGDTVLQRLARLLTGHLVPEVDLGARNGGDEFCAILRNAHKSEAIARAQAFCDAVRSTDFGVRAPITASIGVAAFPYDASGASELLEIADAAMYHSKRSGRDRVAYPDGSGCFTVYR